MADNNERPSKTIKLSESEIEVTMTYVVFNDVLRFVGSIDEAMTSLMTNQETRDLVIRRLLTDNKKPVDKLEELISPAEVNIDIFEMDELLAWAMQHITYFFMRTAARLQESVAKFPELAKKMTTSSDPSETGSVA